MDYKDIHEQAIAMARLLVSEGKLSQEIAEKMFPELAESEDERIRKAIIKGVSQIRTRPGEITQEQMIAYLEKQKEQKPNCKYECPLTDKHLMATDFWKAYLEDCLIPGAKPTKQDIEFLLPFARKYFSLIMKDVCNVCKDWSNGYQKGLELGKQKPAELSEEDERMLNVAIRSCEQTIEDYPSNTIRFKDCISWLQSLRPQPHWKPSEEQMETVHTLAIKYEKKRLIGVSDVLKSLYEDLKKL